MKLTYSSRETAAPCEDEEFVAIGVGNFVEPTVMGMNAMRTRTRHPPQRLVLSELEAAMIGKSQQFSDIIKYTAHDSELVKLVLRRLFCIEVVVEKAPPEAGLCPRCSHVSHGSSECWAGCGPCSGHGRVDARACPYCGGLDGAHTMRGCRGNPPKHEEPEARPA